MEFGRRNSECGIWSAECGRRNAAQRLDADRTLPSEGEMRKGLDRDLVPQSRSKCGTGLRDRIAAGRKRPNGSMPIGRYA